MAVGLDAGIAAAGAPIPYDPAMVTGLIVAADGISTPWQEGRDRQHLPGDDPTLMELWAPWVRGFILSTEVLPTINFTVEGDGDVTLHAMKRQVSGSSLRVVGRQMLEIKRPNEHKFRQQLDLVRAHTDLRADRQAEIISQLGFPTPYFGSIVSLHPSRDARVLELIAVVQGLGATISMRTKHALACRRPDELSDQIMPMIPTPGHGSFPAAHAVEAFAVGELLKMLFFPGSNDADERGRKALDRQAARVSQNRVIAGVHYPVDSYLGAVLGRMLTHHLALLADQSAPVLRVKFAGDRFDGEEDFDHRAITPDDGEVGLKRKHPELSVAHVRASLPPSAPLRWLWEEAKHEIALRNDPTKRRDGPADSAVEDPS
ncbi:MAG: hypothetical protein AAGG47_22085 [Pseudomonadota bacterium]